MEPTIENATGRFTLKKLAFIIALAILIGLAIMKANAQTVVGTTQFAKRGQSSYRVVTCTQPAAGAEFSCTVPAGHMYYVISMQFTLTTDATVANRNVTLLFDDGSGTANVWHRSNAQFGGTLYNHTASLTATYNVYPCSGVNGTGAVVILNTICDLVLGPNYRVRSSTNLIKSGDQYSSITMFVEDWPINN